MSAFALVVYTHTHTQIEIPHLEWEINVRALAVHLMSEFQKKLKHFKSHIDFSNKTGQW